MIPQSFLDDVNKEIEYSKNAFNCSKCPKEGCPAWLKARWDFVDEKGLPVVKHVEACSFRVLPIINHVSLASNYRNYDAIVLKSNEILQIFKKSFTALAKLFMNVFKDSNKGNMIKEHYD